MDIADKNWESGEISSTADAGYWPE